MLFWSHLANLQGKTQSIKLLQQYPSLKLKKEILRIKTQKGFIQNVWN